MDYNQIAVVDSEIGSMRESEGDSFTGEEIIGCENPKIIEWEELQQELARLWSLSSALIKAKERKESLADQLDPVIEVQQRYLQQSNELDGMRLKLEAKKLAMGETAMQMKETMEDVKFKTEQLGTALRSLLVAGKKVCAVHQQLQMPSNCLWQLNGHCLLQTKNSVKEANKLVIGKMGYGNVKSLQKMLRIRQQHMIAQVNSLYPVKPLDEQSTKEKFDLHCGGDSTQSSSLDSAQSSAPDRSRPPPVSSLTILGQQLTALPLKKTSFFSDKKEIQRSAVVLGYVTHAVSLIASYLDVHLRYPMHLRGSHSYIHDYAPSVDTTSSDLAVSLLFGANAKTTEFPLFLEGQDSTRAAYAIFLLNKDLEQLLNFFGAESLGPRHILANLKELMRIIRSQEFLDM